MPKRGSVDDWLLPTGPSFLISLCTSYARLACSAAGVATTKSYSGHLYGPDGVSSGEQDEQSTQQRSPGVLLQASIAWCAVNSRIPVLHESEKVFMQLALPLDPQVRSQHSHAKSRSGTLLLSTAAPGYLKKPVRLHSPEISTAEIRS